MDFGTYNAENLHEIPGTDPEILINTFVTYFLQSVFKDKEFLKLSCHAGGHIMIILCSIMLDYIQANIKINIVSNRHNL